MPLLDSIGLGIIQGITEFLPVSSSAHLKLFKHFMELDEGQGQVLLDLSCHLGTLFALLLVFRKDIFLLLKDKKQIALFFLALLPLVPCYVLLKPLREMASRIECLGPCLMGTGGILLAGQWLRMTRSAQTREGPTVKDVMMIGAFQSAALIPGISRSAATISCARILGWAPSQAVRFSFLLSIPTILGGNCIELMKSASLLQTEIPLSALGTAFLSSLLVGLCLVQKAIAYLEKGNLKPFAWYCLTLGCFVTLYLTV